MSIICSRRWKPNVFGMLHVPGGFLGCLVCSFILHQTLAKRRTSALTFWCHFRWLKIEFQWLMAKQGKGPNKHELMRGLKTELVHSQAMPFLCDSPVCWWQTEKVFWRPFLLPHWLFKIIHWFPSSFFQVTKPCVAALVFQPTPTAKEWWRFVAF